jgi:DsbC/DsbD-like thiol-disulfide interchange protein
MRKYAIALAAAGLSLGLAAAASAQSVTVTATASGSKVTLKLRIPAGYHVYGPTEKSGVPTAITVKDPKGAKVLIAWPKTKPYQTFEGTAQIYAGVVTIPVTIKSPAKVGRISLSVATQLCNDRTCLPPAEANVTVALKP